MRTCSGPRYTDAPPIDSRDMTRSGTEFAAGGNSHPDPWAIPPVLPSTPAGVDSYPRDNVLAWPLRPLQDRVERLVITDPEGRGRPKQAQSIQQWLGMIAERVAEAIERKGVSSILRELAPAIYRDDEALVVFHWNSPGQERSVALAFDPTPDEDVSLALTWLDGTLGDGKENPSIEDVCFRLAWLVE